MPESANNHGSMDRPTPTEGYREVFEFVEGQEDSTLAHELNEDPGLNSIFQRAKTAFIGGSAERGWQTLEGLLVEIDENGGQIESKWTDSTRELSLKLTAAENPEKEDWSLDQVAEWFHTHGSEEVQDLFLAAVELPDGEEKSSKLQTLISKVELAICKAAFDPNADAELKTSLRSIQQAIFLDRMISDESIADNHDGVGTVRSSEDLRNPAMVELLTFKPAETLAANEQVIRGLRQFALTEFQGIDDKKSGLFVEYLTKTIECTIQQHKLSVADGQIGQGDRYAGNINTLRIPGEAHYQLARMLNKSRADRKGFSEQDVLSYSDGLITLSMRDVCQRLGIDTSKIDGFSEAFSDRGVSMDDYLSSRS